MGKLNIERSDSEIISDHRSRIKESFDHPLIKSLLALNEKSLDCWISKFYRSEEKRFTPGAILSRRPGIKQQQSKICTLS